MPDAELTTLSAGWTYDPYHGAVYHFEHLPLTEAKVKAGDEFDVYAVEEINWTVASEPDQPAGRKRPRKKVHLNTYYEIGFGAALALASRLQLDHLASSIAADVVAIRRATDAEADAYQAIEERLRPEPRTYAEADAYEPPPSAAPADLPIGGAGG